MEPKYDQSLRRAYLSRNLSEPTFDGLESHLTNGALERIVAEIMALGTMTVSLLPLDLPWSRSYALPVGLATAPSWAQFNYGMSSSDQLDAIRVSGGGLPFWTIRLSRVYPAWTGTWNEFVRSRGRPLPKLRDTVPTGWESIVTNCTAILLRHGLQMLDERELNRPVTWMTGSTLQSGAMHPLLYECLFLEY